MRSNPAKMMLRVVLDTNIVVSGMLWSGVPSKIMEAVYTGRIRPVVTELLLDELSSVLGRPKFENRLKLVGKSVDELIHDYVVFAEIIDSQPLPRPVSVDRDDDMFIACAIAGKVTYLVSGDPHVLNVGRYEDVQIITAVALLPLMSVNPGMPE